MTYVIANSLADAGPAILTAMRLSGKPWIEVWIPSEKVGYWAVLKQSRKPVAEQSIDELKRELRKIKNPQPYDVALIEWDSFMYRGYHKTYQSSAF